MTKKGLCLFQVFYDVSNFVIMQVFLSDVMINETALEISDPAMFKLYQLIHILRLYLLPVVCVVGFILQLWVIILCCNPLSPTRRSSLQPYLVSLALADIVFLVMVMLDWVKATNPTLDFYSRLVIVIM